jgi:hypothetical protein
VNTQEICIEDFPLPSIGKVSEAKLCRILISRFLRDQSSASLTVSELLESRFRLHVIGPH